jgi:hypothetical protein
VCVPDDNVQTHFYDAVVDPVMARSTVFYELMTIQVTRQKAANRT